MVKILDVKSERLNDRLAELHEALIGAGRHGDAATMIEDETRLFLRGVINLTPPPGLGQDAKRVGESAVRLDLNRLFTPIDDEFLNVIGSQFGIAGIDEWITGKSGNKIHLKWDHLDSTGSGMRQFHDKNRNSRGRVTSRKRQSSDAWYARYIVSKEDFAAYAAKVISHVGRRKAAWAKSYQEIPGGGWSVPRWIGRHISNAFGRCINMTGSLHQPSITVSNFSPGIGDDERLVRDQMRIRFSAIGRKMRGIISGYSEDWKRGVKIQKQMRASA